MNKKIELRLYIGLVWIEPWQICLGQAANLGARYREPGPRIAVWLQLPGLASYPNKPIESESSPKPSDNKAGCVHKSESAIHVHTRCHRPASTTTPENIQICRVFSPL